MALIEARVEKIEQNDILHMLTLDMQGLTLKMITLELSEDIGTGKNVKLGVKPINIALAQEGCGQLSFSNQIPAMIVNIIDGKLLSSITLRLPDGTDIESIITKESAQKLALKTSESVIAIIKATDLFVVEVMDG